jgi:hypothetical protein
MATIRPINNKSNQKVQFYYGKYVKITYMAGMVPLYVDSACTYVS